MIFSLIQILLVLTAGTYAALVAYRALFLLLFTLFFRGVMIASYFLGHESGAGYFLAGVLQAVGTNLFILVPASFLTVTALLFLLRGRLNKTARLLGLLAVLALSLLAGVMDTAYRITPLSGFLPAPAAKEENIEAEKMTLQAIKVMTDVKPRVEVRGVLGYQASMKRFVLNDPESPGDYIKVYPYKGKKLFGASFQEMEEAGFEKNEPPVYYDELKDFVGKAVRVTGAAGSANIRAAVSDIRE